MKQFLLTLILLATLGCAVHLPPALVTSPVDRVLQSIVKVTFKIDEGNYHLCTGFVVDSARGRVLTVRHCVEDLPVVQVDGNDSTVMSTTESLALLAIPSMSKPALDIRNDTLPVGEPVQAFGFGWGEMFVFGRHVAAFSKDGQDVALDGPLAQGMSGGPVVDGNGKVVGINQGTNEVIGILCGQNEIRKFLKDNK